MFPVNC